MPTSLDRNRPSGVRGPVLAPPCSRHRVLFRMAGQRHGVPFRALAPHRAIFGSPGGLPFWSHPRGLVGGSGFAIGLFPLLGSLPVVGSRALVIKGAYNRLTSAVHVDVFDRAVLFPLAAIFLQCLHLSCERAHQPAGAIDVYFYPQIRLVFNSCWCKALHRPTTFCDSFCQFDEGII
jgi:hypothetical protein